MKKKLSLKKTVLGGLAFLGILFLAAVAFVIYTIRNVDYKYTGEDLFEAVNAHREIVGVQKLELDPILCDNLVERYLAIKEPNNGHKGFTEWLTDEGINKNPKYGQIGELYITASTPENAISWWMGSPGHKSTLEMSTLKYGCAYASEGTGVVVVAEERASE